MKTRDLGLHNAGSHVDVDLTRPVFNGLTTTMTLLEQGRAAGAKMCLDVAERWARASMIALQAAEDAAGGSPEQTGFVVTADELRCLHDYVMVALEYLHVGRVQDCLEATAVAWRRAKVATECLEAAALINAQGHARVTH